MKYLGTVWKTEYLGSFPRRTIQHHSNLSLCPTPKVEETEVEQFYDDLKDLLELTPKKGCPFHHRWLECKSRKSRGTWNNRHIWPRSTEWCRANTEFCQENPLVIANPLFQQHEKTIHIDITRWSILKSDWLYSLQPKMEKLYKNKTGSWLRLRSWAPYCKIQA